MKNQRRSWTDAIKRPVQLYAAVLRAGLIGAYHCPACGRRVFEFGHACPHCGARLAGREWERTHDIIEQRWNRLSRPGRLLCELLWHVEQVLESPPLGDGPTPRTKRRKP